MIDKALFTTGKNDWETPQWLFDELNEEFHFTLDPCATPETAKCKKYYTEEDNGLSKDWTGEVVFCNPPYSNKQQTEWVRKCYEHAQNGGVAVMLIPARTDTARFHQYIYGKAEIRFIQGRLKFGNSINSAPFPSMILVFRKQMATFDPNRICIDSNGNYAVISKFDYLQNNIKPNTKSMCEIVNNKY